MSRVKPNVTVRRNVCNQSSRGGYNPRLIVLHSTEGFNIPGDQDLENLGAWFDNPSAQASSHVGTDADGNSARYVPDTEKAWTCAGFNAVSLNIEQVGKASQGNWAKEELQETARWVARWNKKYGIPIARGKVSGSKVVAPGVVLHSELGSYGGGHSDPGAAYPVSDVLGMAKNFRKQL